MFPEKLYNYNFLLIISLTIFICYSRYRYFRQKIIVSNCQLIIEKCRNVLASQLDRKPNVRKHKWSILERSNVKRPKKKIEKIETYKNKTSKIKKLISFHQTIFDYSSFDFNFSIIITFDLFHFPHFKFQRFDSHLSISIIQTEKQNINHQMEKFINFFNSNN